jgi:hypothetical protein
MSIIGAPLFSFQLKRKPIESQSKTLRTAWKKALQKLIPGGAPGKVSDIFPRKKRSLLFSLVSYRKFKNNSCRFPCPQN